MSQLRWLLQIESDVSEEHVVDALVAGARGEAALNTVRADEHLICSARATGDDD